MTTDTQTTNSQAAAICDCLSIAIKYASMLVDDIPANQFGHMPHPNMNHPAFCLGHLSVYPNYVLNMIGRADLVVEKPGWKELFEAPTPCVEQDGRYPSKSEIMAHFLERHEKVAAALSAVNGDVLTQANEGHFKGRIKTVGGVVTFMLTSHPMLHLGQVSAWRRAMGMAAVM